LIAQPLIFFRSVLFKPQSHIPFDIEAFHLPLATYIARCARERIFAFLHYRMLGLSVVLTILSGFPAATFVVFGSVVLFVLGVCSRAAEPQNLVHAPSASYRAATVRERSFPGA